MEKIGLYLLVFGITLNVFLCVMLFRRRAHQRVPFFFSYTVFAVVSEIGGLLLILPKHRFAYFFFYWITESIFVILAFMALYETFHWVFRNFRDILWFRAAFPVMGGLMLFIALVRSLLLPVPDLDRLLAAIITLKIAVGFLQVGIFGLFMLLVRFFHVRWQQYAFGIAFGFGIIACSDLAVFLLRSEFGKNFNPVVTITPPIAYIIAVVVWLAAFIPPQPDHPLKNWVPPLTPEEMIADLRQYTETIKGALKR